MTAITDVEWVLLNKDEAKDAGVHQQLHSTRDDPVPRRGHEGSDIIGPRNPDRERQEPDIICPPSTDAGKLPNMKWSFADSHMRIEDGGWARETTVRELPTSTELAAVNMRLDEGAYRELHWHTEAEWAYILKGSCRITVLDLQGGCYIDDLHEGDLWYFPTGFPHSIQGESIGLSKFVQADKEQGMGKGGTEFLLIFDDGNFSEDSTFLLTDWLAHTPKEVLGKNFQLPEHVFDSLSEREKYIFRGTVPGSLDQDRKQVTPSKHRFTHRMLAQEPIHFPGGEVRIADTSNFPISTTVAAAHVIIKPHGLRTMHWHPNASEWSYFIRGRARVTIFASGGTARTFDYQAGDIGIVPQNMGHFVENIGDETVEMLEVFRAPHFEDFSLEQFLAQTPRTMVVEHLNLTGSEAQSFIDGLSKKKIDVKPPRPRRNSVSF